MCVYVFMCAYSYDTHTYIVSKYRCDNKVHSRSPHTTHLTPHTTHHTPHITPHTPHTTPHHTPHTGYMKSFSYIYPFVLVYILPFAFTAQTATIWVTVLVAVNRLVCARSRVRVCAHRSTGIALLTLFM